MNKIPASPVWVTTQAQLEGILEEVLSSKEVSRFLFLNQWDIPCQTLRTRLKASEKSGGETVYVIDTFDIPMGLGIIRDSIKQLRGVVQTNIENYTGTPMMVRIHGDHGNFPIPVSYTGSIFAELGL